MFNPRTIADEADVIIDGFAFINKEEDGITIVNLNREGHGALVFPSGEVVETSMDEIWKIQRFIKDNYKEMYLKWASISETGFYEGN